MSGYYNTITRKGVLHAVSTIDYQERDRKLSCDSIKLNFVLTISLTQLSITRGTKWCIVLSGNAHLFV